MSRPKAIVFSQGDEVVTGATVDTNAAFIADHCRTLGFEVIRHITVADVLADLVRVIKEIDQLADVCLCTGGLGPTQDDLTTEAFSEAFNVALEFDNEALEMMQSFFDKLRVEMADVNRKQALLPKGSTRINNQWGTAPGFIGEGEHCRFYFMPGVPYEMKNMMASTVLDDLAKHFQIEKPQLITLRTMGIGESKIQQELNKLDISDDVRISFRAGLPENELKLLFPSRSTAQQVRSQVDAVTDLLGDAIFAVDGLEKSVKNLPDCVHQLMLEQQQTLGLVESLSQGHIAYQCQAEWLRQSLIYTKASDILSAYAISLDDIDESTTLALAQKEHDCDKATMSLVQLYRQGDAGDVTVYTAITNGQSSCSKSNVLTGRLERQRINAAAAAFNLIRQYLQTK